MRLPYGMKALIGEVKALRPGASYDFSDPDGIEVYRTLRFDKRTSKWLTPLLERLGDKRITELRVTDAGYLYVTFTGEPLADSKNRWPLAATAAVIRAEASTGRGQREGDRPE